MFSRAAKSVVKSLGQRKYHVGEDTLKMTAIKNAGEIGQNISQLLKQTTRLNQLNVYDVARTGLSGTQAKIPSIKFEEQNFQSHKNRSPSGISTQKFLPSGLAAAVPVNNQKTESLPSVAAMNQESLMFYFTTCELETDRAIPKLDPLSSEMAAEITSQKATGNSSIREFTNSPSLPTIGSSGLVESLMEGSNLKNPLHSAISSMGNCKQEAHNWSRIRAVPRVLGEMGPSRNSYQNAKEELLKLLPQSEDCINEFSPTKKKMKRKSIKRKRRKHVQEEMKISSRIVNVQSRKITSRIERKPQSYIHKSANNKIIDKGDWMLPATFDNRKPVLLHNFEGDENIVRCGVTMIPQDLDQYYFSKSTRFKKQRDKAIKIRNVTKISTKLCGSTRNIEIDNKIRSVCDSYANLPVEKIDRGVQMNIENMHFDKEDTRNLEEFQKLEESYDKSFPIISNVEQEASEVDKLTDHKFESILIEEIFKTDKQRNIEDDPVTLNYPSKSTITSYHLDDLYEERGFMKDPEESNELYLAPKEEDSRSKCNKMIEDYCKKKRSGKKNDEKDSCKREKKRKKKKEEDPCKKKEDTCKRSRKKDSCERERKTKDPCKNWKKDEKKSRKDCPDMKKIEPCKKKKCPPVIKAPECPEKSNKGKKNCSGCISFFSGSHFQNGSYQIPGIVVREDLIIQNRNDFYQGYHNNSKLHNNLSKWDTWTVSRITENRSLDIFGILENERIPENERNNVDGHSMLNYKNENLAVADSQDSKKTSARILMQEPDDRIRNDDYFPLGEEYEDEIGTDDNSLSRGIRPNKSKNSKMEEDYDNMIPICLSDKKGLEIGREKSMLFVRTNPWTGTILDKNITEKDTWRKLQMLIDKVVEFKRGIFHTQIVEVKVGTKMETRKESDLNNKTGSPGSREKRVATQSSKGLRLGEPDCGEGRPERPKRGPCHPPEGPCTPLPPPGYPSKPKPEKKPFCVKCPPKKPCDPRTCQSETEGTWTGGNVEGSVLKLYCKPQAAPEAIRHRTCRQILGSHGTTSGERSEVGIWRVGDLWCCEKPRGLLVTRDKKRWLYSIRRGYASRWRGRGKGSSSGKHPLDSSKPPPTVAPAPCPEVAKKREKVPCREEGKDSSCTPCSKPCPPPQKCVPPPPPCCRPRPPNPKCASGPAPPCPPPCPCPCPPKPPPPPPPKICYRKCPPPPKLPRLPKFVAPPPPPKPPPLPKLPRRPKCPPPCPPPRPPPLPKCPKCPPMPPPCPPCPPPPPCEPCPCPPPCPPPCCPPPPPCPPCPPPKECPKPLPCPPPPPPPVCPPCPPCTPCPKPKPCPPSPPCCPCPCPPPPPPCPCPPACPPPPAVQPPPECPKDVKSCPPSTKKATKSSKDKKTNKRKMSTYQHPTHSLNNSLKDIENRTSSEQSVTKKHTRHFKTACFSLFSSSGNCKTTEEICADQDKKLGLSETCSTKQSEGGCYPEKKACPKKKNKKKEKCLKSFQKCSSSCLPVGKCVVPPPPSVEKITYERPVCPPPKFAPPTPCPPLASSNKANVCTEHTSSESDCPPPPPMPKPPCAPVILCPCPPPPKLPPGPCPCPISLQDPETLPPSTPCPIKPKYSCPDKNIKCNLDTVEMLCNKKSKKPRKKDKKHTTKS